MIEKGGAISPFRLDEKTTADILQTTVSGKNSPDTPPANLPSGSNATATNESQKYSQSNIDQEDNSVEIQAREYVRDFEEKKDSTQRLEMERQLLVNAYGIPQEDLWSIKERESSQ